MQEKKNNKRKIAAIICGVSVGVLIAGTGVGVGVGYAIWHNNKIVDGPAVKFTKRNPTDKLVLSQAGDSVSFDVTIENGQLSDYYGTELKFDDQFWLLQEGYIKMDNTTAQDQRTGIFWNDPSDMHQGVYIQIVLSKAYDAEGFEQNLTQEMRVVFSPYASGKKVKTSLEGIQIINFSNVAATPEGEETHTGDISNVDSSHFFTGGGAITADTGLPAIMGQIPGAIDSTDYGSINVSITNNTAPAPWNTADKWFSTHITAEQLAVLYMIEARNIWKYVMNGQSNYTIELDVNMIQRTNQDSTVNEDHNFNIGITQYVRYNNYLVEHGNLNGAEVPCANYFAVNGSLTRFADGWNHVSHFPFIDADSTGSRNLYYYYDNSNIIEGYLNVLWCNPNNDQQTNITAIQVANEFFPTGVTFS